jgi:hypothetical protein
VDFDGGSLLRDARAQLPTGSAVPSAEPTGRVEQLGAPRGEVGARLPTRSSTTKPVRRALANPHGVIAVPRCSLRSLRRLL